MIRSLAPAGGFPSPDKVRRLLSHGELIDIAREAIGQLFPDRAISFYSSGTEALESILQGFSGSVSVSGFNCPDIVAAAVRAGLKVVPVDISEETLQPQFGESDAEVVILSNLYGLADPAPEGRAIIDDACQAALSFTSRGERLGSRGLLGVLSFGRGKALCGIGGGVALGALADAAQVADTSQLADRPLDLLKLQLASVLERPEFYFIPQNAPFLRLGETIYRPGYRHRSLSRVQLAAGVAQIQSEVETRRTLAANTARWLELLSDLPSVSLPARYHQEGALTRFPLLFSSEERREKLCQRLRNLGASRSYNGALTEICHGESRLITRELRVAKSVARRLLTLPTHRYVTPEDMEKVREIIKRC
jgi:dTDP-4-amino-4,6-dideoxygalactose transaminase